MFHKIARGYLKTVEGICITLLFIIFLLMVIQVVCRLFTIGQNFTEELARICFCLMILSRPVQFDPFGRLKVTQ